MDFMPENRLTIAQQVARAASAFQQQRTGHAPKAAEVETATGTVVHAFTSGTMVQVFLLAQTVSTEDWNRTGPDDRP
jgi:hypothetical protein